MSLFPIIQPELSASTEKMPIYKEIAWNYKTNFPVWRGGEPYIVSGAQAVASWAFRALQVPRYRFEIYSWDYGSEFEELIGTVYSEELKKAEAKRYVKECLLVNSYITDVDNIEIVFTDGALKISCTIKTVYGEVSVNV